MSRKKRSVASSHPPARAEASAAQAAAQAPKDDVEAQGKTANAEKMNEAEPKGFDQAAFVAAVEKAVADKAPKNLDEADKFAGSGKADEVREEVRGKVGEGKAESAEQIADTTAAPPDTSAAVTKQVTPLAPDRPPAAPGAPDARDAVPDELPASATDLSAGPAEVSGRMSEAQVTEPQLRRANEPAFTKALGDKKTAEQHSATTPKQMRKHEAGELRAATAGARQAGGAAMGAMAAQRMATGQRVGAGKTGAKSRDEEKRAEVTAILQKVFDGMKNDVEQILSHLDTLVDAEFSKGEKEAREAFTAEHRQKMEDYKDRRYSGLDGKARWFKDLFAGLPAEADRIFDRAREGYLRRMRQVVSGVAATIGRELDRAKQRIAKGRSELRTAVDRLPADLKAVGREAAAEFEGRFEELARSVDDKATGLVDTLASKYTEALKSVDDEIAAGKEKNRGLVDKAVAAVKGVIDTILELKRLLLGVLAKAASAVMLILKDPIGFLRNLVRAVGAGLRLFLRNIGRHLQQGVMSWLLGRAAEAGLQLPARFDARGVLTMLAGLLGLSWPNIRTRLARRVPEQALTAAETSVPLVAEVRKRGVAGMWDDLRTRVGDLRKTLLDKVVEYVTPTIVVAGITWILSLLNPASAFVRAVKLIIDVVTFVVTQARQIIDFVNAVLDSVIAIAKGATGAVPALVERSLARTIPLLLAFLAALLGLGGIAARVRRIVQAMARPVNQAIDKVLDKIVGLVKRLWARMRPTRRDRPGHRAGRDRRARTGRGRRTRAGRRPQRRDARRRPRRDDPRRKTTDLDDKRRRLGRGIQAAVRKINSYEGLLAPEEKSRADLRAIRSRYRLTELRAVKAGPRWRVEGAVNPTASSATSAPTPKEIRESIRATLTKYGPRQIEKIHKDWGTQLEKARIDGQPIWTGEDLKGTEKKALTLLGTESTASELIGYFDQNRSKDLADTDTFRKYALHNEEPKPGHDVRKKFLEALGAGALAKVKGIGPKRIKTLQADASDIALINEVPGIGFVLKNYRYGQFTDLPGTGAKADPDLKAAVEAAGALGKEKPIINFLKAMVESGANIKGVTPAKFFEMWKVGANSNWIKEQFRAASPGRHEWIPSNFIDRVLQTALDSRERLGVENAKKWITLQHALRSFTCDVIWDLRVDATTTEVTRDNLHVHTGAFTENTFSSVADPIYHGDAEKINSVGGPEVRIQPGGLRGIFEMYRQEHGSDGTPEGFLKDLQQKLETGKIMWDGNLDTDLPDRVLKLPIEGEYKRKVTVISGTTTTSTVKVVKVTDMTVERLAEEQQESYARVLNDFVSARDKLK